MLEDGAINEFPDGVIPDEIRLIFVARWLKGAATLDWLIEHPDWYAWADICSVAFSQAENLKAERANQQSSGA